MSVGFFTTFKRRGSSDSFGHAEPSDAHIAWLNSSPQPGEVLVDTGLASAVDCQKLRRPPEAAKRDELDREIARMKTFMERSRDLNVETEGARVNDLVADALHRVGLDPERFGVSLPPEADTGGAG